MSDIAIIICLVVLIMLIGVIAVLMAYLLIEKGSGERKPKRNEPESFYTPTAAGRYWHIEIWNRTNNQMYAKDFCGQVMLGRSIPASEPFWQMRIGDDRTISREQCVIYDRSGFLVIENISQINITMLNGYPVTMPMLIQEGCQLSMGSNYFIITNIQRVA